MRAWEELLGKTLSYKVQPTEGRYTTHQKTCIFLINTDVKYGVFVWGSILRVCHYG